MSDNILFFQPKLQKQKQAKQKQANNARQAARFLKEDLTAIFHYNVFCIFRPKKKKWFRFEGMGGPVGFFFLPGQTYVQCPIVFSFCPASKILSSQISLITPTIIKPIR